MSDKKKDEKSSAGKMFTGGRESIRDVVPTEAEGDALLDMLFDDAPRPSRPGPAPNAPATPDLAEPPPDDEEQPTRIHAAEEVQKLVDSVRQPLPLVGPGAVGEVVAPPGWKMSPAPPSARGRAPIPPSRPTPKAPEPSGDVAVAEEEAGVAAFATEEDLDDDASVHGEVDLTEVGSLPIVEPHGAEHDERSGGVSGSAPSPFPGSSPPRPLSRAPAPQSEGFADERDASIVLAAEPTLRDSYLERARWMRAEAALVPDRAARARLLLVASELLAMVGEDDEAAAVADEIHRLQAGVTLGMRQHRMLLAQRGRWPQAVEVMDAEARVMPTPESKCHVAWLSAEVARLAQSDEAAAKKRAELALRAMPADPRAHVQRFAEALTPGADPNQLLRVRPADAQGVSPEVIEAFTRVAALRGAPVPAQAEGAPASTYEGIVAARAALSHHDVGRVVRALHVFEGGALGAAAGWLGGFLAQSTPETRALAEPMLKAAALGSHPTHAQKALASVAIESGGEVDVTGAPEAFSEADRIAIAALSGKVSALDDGGIAEDRELEVLKSATRAAARTPGRLSELDERGIDPPSVSLARALADHKTSSLYSSSPVPAKLAFAREMFESDNRSTAALRGLAFELDLESRSIEKMTAALTGASEGSEPDASSLLAAATISEAGGDVDLAKTLYAKVRDLAPPPEAVLRAELRDADSADIARTLIPYAESLPNGPRKLSLLLEAAIRLGRFGSDTPPPEGAEGPPEGSEEAAAALKAAAEMDAAGGTGLVTYLGAHIARTAGDHASLVEWLRTARENSDDPTERAYEVVREALLLSEPEPAHAGALLEEALRTHPKDMGLRDLYERVLSEPPADRAAFHEARSREETGSTAARLAIQAAYEYEQQGDIEGASRAIKLAEAAGDDAFAPVCSYRFALAGFGASEFVDALLPKARAAEDPRERLETYERLAELDERGTGDVSSSLLFRRTILEENPTHLRTLRRVASALMAQGREEELEPIAFDLARTLDGPEAHAYAALSARLRGRAKWEDTLEPVKLAYKQEPRTVWSIRQMAAHARSIGDHALAARCDQELSGRVERAPERATLAMRAAESFEAAGDLGSAKEMYEKAVTAAGVHPMARLGYAEALERSGDYTNAAQELEAAAELILTPAWRAEVDYRAGVLFEDHVKDVEKARAAFERVFVQNPKNDDVFHRLRKLYVAAGARAELAELLERRLDSVDDPAERVEMEVMRGKALAEVGDAAAAKRALLAALESNPDHVDALSAFGELAESDQDYEGAEQALIRLARLTGDSDKQADIYMRLGGLYDEHLPNPDRAELAYQEILKRKPDDLPAREKLIGLYVRTANFARAIEEQTSLVDGASTPELKCQRTVELAEILEQAGDLKKSENTLVAARKAYPKSDLALRALVQFYQRNNQAPSAAVILDRSVADARRALSTGRFEPYLFETLWTASELRGRHDAAAVARATVQALDGHPVELEGAGARAADANLDDLLAPDVMTPAFRELLLKTGPMLDTAVPFNTDSVRAAPAQNGGPGIDETRELARAYGMPQLNVLVSPVLGPVCIPATAHPPTIVLGQSFVTSEDAPVRTFLIHRALKVLQANAAPFGRTAPIDLWPLLAAYLKALLPTFNPQGVDAAKLNEAHARLSKAVPAGMAPDVGVLAADVVGSIGNRASTLNTVVNGWGARAALLAVADPNVALTAIAIASGAMNGPPAEGKDRVTWVGRNAEARDLVVFSVSDAYSDARTRLGLG